MGGLAIITGADGDMGSEITLSVARKGYEIIMLSYTKEKGEQRKQQIIQKTKNTSINVIQVDLSKMKEVHRVANEILKLGKRIDLLMNNAGIMSRQGRIITEDGLEKTVAINYMAPFLLTLKLLPLMGRGTRIVNMISCTYAIGKITKNFFSLGCEGTFYRIPVYSNTKLALWLFTRKLSLLVEKDGISVNAADPGIVSTKFIHLDLWFDPLTDIFFRPLIRNPLRGASTAISLLLDETWEKDTGWIFLTEKKKNLSNKYLNHPQMDKLWDDTIKFLKGLKLED